MRALIMKLRPDGSREKAMVSNWPDPPAPVANQVRTRTLLTGVTNGTERNNLLRGNYAIPDEALPAGCGYQNVGEVIEVGPEVRDLAVGDVLFMSQDHAETCVVPEDALLVKLPPDVEPTHAALFGMAAVALHDVRRAETKLGDRVLVVGAGPIGQFTAQAARAAGAHVTVVDPNERRLAVAAECGAHRTIPVTGDDTWSGPIRAAGPYDVVFEDSGAAVLENLIGRTWGQSMLRPRGRLVLIAGRFDVNYPFNAAQGCELTVLHAGHFTRDDLVVLCGLVTSGAVRVGPILQDLVKPEEAGGIYDRLRDEPASLLGTVFDWR